uniref:tRNA (34-2'-O)-methyltransferase regulator WDR6 n=1 Tax=Magallana gigas TaxID=29159 RepID=K1QY02_MAGGI
MEQKNAIQGDFMTGPVTALQTVGDNIVLAGIGSYLHSFVISEQKSNSCLLVLPCRCIHGIREFTNETDVHTFAVFGEKCVTIVDYHSAAQSGKNGGPLDHSDYSITITTRAQMTEFEDWIWDAVFLKPKDSCHLALALGHNSVILWDWKHARLVEKVSCVESCILYPLLQGVIFSVDFSHQKQMMCSASDDRSIRLWQFSFDNHSNLHETEIPLESWENSSCTCVHVLYGHSARVWDVRLLTCTLVSVGEDSTCCVWNYEGDVLQKFKGHRGKSIWSLSVDEKERYVVTGGGDTSVRLWYLSSRSERSNYVTQSLQLQQTSSEKEDDYPRSVSLLSYNEIIIITNKGFLYLHDIEKERWLTLMNDPEYRSYTVMSVAPAQQSCIVLGNIHGKLRIFLAEGSQPVWKRKDWDIYDGKMMSIHWLSGTRLLTTGPEGGIKLWNFDADTLNLGLDEQYILPECKQRWVSAASVSHGSLICGDRGGTIHVYQLGSEFRNPSQSFPKIHGKTGVMNIICHKGNVYTSGRDGCYRVFSHEDGHMTLLNTHRVYKGFEWIDKLQIADDGADYHIFGFQSSDFVLWSVNRNQKLLQIPCGGGHRSWDCSIRGEHFRFVYQKTREVVVCDTRLEQNQLKLKNALHGREITCVKLLDANTEGCIVATGSEDTSVQISAIRLKIKLSSATILKIEHEKGFLNILQDNEFGVKEMVCLEHLSGHISSVRALSLCPSSKDSINKKSTLMFSAGGRAQLLVWRLTIRDSTFIVTENLCMQMIGQTQKKGKTRMWKLQQIKLNPETRFMDLSSVQLCSVWCDFPAHLHLLASACSDAFVRFYIFNEEKTELIPFLESSLHEHCVLKVCCLKRQCGSDSVIYILSAATDGCIAFWKVNKKDIHETVQKFSQPNLDNRIFETCSFVKCDIHVSSANNFNLREDLLDKESMWGVLPSNHKQHILKSDDRNDSQCNDEGQISNKEHDSGMSATNMESNSSKENSIQRTKHVYFMKHHQSGVNGLDYIHLQDDDYLIASGGDDNALVVTLVRINSEGVKVVTTGSCLCAHSTEITATADELDLFTVVISGEGLATCQIHGI